MEDQSWLCCLPDDPFLHILSYLDYTDLVTCSRLCKRLCELCNTQSLWRRHCSIYWEVHSKEDDMTWKECFVDWYGDWGRYIDVYPALNKAWNQIRAFVKENCPRIHQSLMEGLTDAQLDDLEKRVKCQLPADYRCSFRLCGGQDLGVDAEVPGVMGSLEFATSDGLTPECLPCPLHVNISERGCISVSYLNSDFCFTLLATTDEDGFVPGQVFSANFMNTNPIHPAGEFLIANSFLEWLTTYAQQLADGVFPVVDGHILRYYHEPSTVTTTGSITVSVSTAFLAATSNVDPAEFRHSYRITMSMDPSASELDSCQLRTRHWTITDEDGNEEKVEGPGVVGEFPVMRPGSSFSWTSGTAFMTTYGNMRGYFIMTNLHTGCDVRVECPTFHMKCLPYQTRAERTERKLRTKKNQ